MAEGKKKIVVYRDWINTFEELTDEEAGKLIKHFFRYINDLNPEPPDRVTKLLFEPIKQTLKRDLANYLETCKKNKDNITVRWNKNDTTVYDRIPTDTKHTDSDSDSDSVNDNDSSKEKEKKNKYSEFVSLTTEEYNKLEAEHGEKNTYTLITILNNYKGANGKKYKSDYLAILNWVIKRAKDTGEYIGKPKLSM